VLFALYLAGVASALAVAFVLKRTMMRGEYGHCCWSCPSIAGRTCRTWRSPVERTRIFLTRVGTIILTLMVVLWFWRASLHRRGRDRPAISTASRAFSAADSSSVRAIGFNWQISIALVPGLAAREVAVSALGTVYAMSGRNDVAGR